MLVLFQSSKKASHDRMLVSIMCAGITIDGNYFFKETASAGFRKIPPNIKDFLS